MISNHEKGMVKAHMITDPKEMRDQYKARKNPFDVVSVYHNQADKYKDMGFRETKATKRKVTLAKEKDTGRQFEDQVWCLFYELGFKALNNDDNLKVQWGEYPGDSQQLDIVAVNEECIIVVECKAASKSTQHSFKSELYNMEHYMDGVTRALHDTYGEDKKVKFVFATRNYRFEEDCEDLQRMRHAGIYHLNENAFSYMVSLVKSYKGASIYQFMGLMFKDEAINDTDICIPALKGKMGEQEYFIFSIEPATLLKVGFVLHRTKVNDSMAPTYQRLLVPSRLKGITKFIDEGGYFPNSIIINFSTPQKGLEVAFEEMAHTDDSATKLGVLHIPNAYGIAYIIDGQHRLYGYANTDKKTSNTIPVVAFNQMPSEEQLQIFMDINQNQKAVSPSLRLDLEEDLYWNAERLDSRMKALRSSIIKSLSANSNNVLYGKISVGEDVAELAFKPFDTALSKSGLIPKANYSQWVGDTDRCLYNIHETNSDKAMKDARKRITQYLDGVYNILENNMDETIQKDFLFSNRATYAIIVLAGSLHAFVSSLKEHNAMTPIPEQLEAVKPYFEHLAKELNSLSNEAKANITGSLGQGADIFYLRSFQNLVNSGYPEYAPDELRLWKETQDQSLQEEGKSHREKIRECIQTLVFQRLKKLYGPAYEKQIAMTRNTCEGRALEKNKFDDNFNLSQANWEDYLELNDLWDIIDSHFSYPEFSEVFSIDLNASGAKSKKAQLAWFKLAETPTGKKQTALTKYEVNQLFIILSHLKKYINE